MHYVGVDVAKASLEVSDAAGQRRRTFKNTTPGITQMLDWLSRRFSPSASTSTGSVRHSAHHSGEAGGVQIILEPTSTYHHLLVEALSDGGIPFTVINPCRTKAYATLEGKRAKTDRVDAQLLASLGESQELRPSHHPDRRQEKLKSLRRHREWLEQEMRSARNRLDTARCSPWTDEHVIESLERTIGRLEKEVDVVEGKLDEAIEGEEISSMSVALLETIPGVARRTAIMILTELPEAWRCQSSRQWVAFCGLSPEQHQSGGSSWSKLSRAGSARIRRQLYMPAVAAMRWNPSIADHTARLAARGKTGKLAVVAAMNRLIRICFGVLRNQRPFDPQLHLKYLDT